MKDIVCSYCQTPLEGKGERTNIYPKMKLKDKNGVPYYVLQ